MKFKTHTISKEPAPLVKVEKTSTQDHCIFHITSATGKEAHDRSDGVYYPEFNDIDSDTSHHMVSPNIEKVYRRNSETEAFLAGVQKRMEEDREKYLKSTLNITTPRGKQRVSKIVVTKSLTIQKLEDGPLSGRDVNCSTGTPTSPSSLRAPSGAVSTPTSPVTLRGARRLSLSPNHLDSRPLY
jgi:hypothetical protein